MKGSQILGFISWLLGLCLNEVYERTKKKVKKGKKKKGKLIFFFGSYIGPYNTTP